MVRAMAVSDTDIVITEEMASKYRGAGKGGIPRAIRAGVVAYNREKSLPARMKKRKVIAAKFRFLKYGITEEDFLRKYKAQKGRCDLCKRKMAMKGKATHIDHNHTSDQVRGVLHSKCNTHLVAMLESEDLTLALIYFKKWEPTAFASFVREVNTIANST